MAQIVITVVGMVAGLLLLFTDASGLFLGVERTLLWVGLAVAGVVVAWLVEGLTAVCLHAFHRATQIPLTPTLIIVLVAQVCGMILGVLCTAGTNGFSATQVTVGLAMGSLIGTVTPFYIQR